VPQTGQACPSRPYTAAEAWNSPFMPCASRKSRSVDPPRASACAKVDRMASSRRAARGRLMQVGTKPGIDPGAEQGFAGVDVARADHHFAGQQHRLDRRSPACEGRRGSSMASMPGRRVPAPSEASNPAAGATSSPADQTTAPNRRGSVRRNSPREVSRSKWSCAPAGGGRLLKDSEPDMPRCISRPPACPASAAGSRSIGIHRYFPRRATGPMRAPTSDSGLQPSGHRSGFAQANAQHPGVAQGFVDAAPGDLDFREFGHRVIM
jgi:hypothetical protein